MEDNNRIARDIALENTRTGCRTEVSDKDMFDGALCMAEWKDRRAKTVIADIVSNILIDTEYTEGKKDACFEIYERLFGERLEVENTDKSE